MPSAGLWLNQPVHVNRCWVKSKLGDVQGHPCGPEDDDSWMTGGAADLEAELAQRQKELEADVAKHAKRTAQGLSETAPSGTDFDPTEVVSKMKVCRQ